MNVWFILFYYSGTKKQLFKKLNWPMDCKIMTPWNICSIIEIKSHNDNYQWLLIGFDFGNRLKTDYVKFDYVKFNYHFLFFVKGWKLTMLNLIMLNLIAISFFLFLLWLVNHDLLTHLFLGYFCFLANKVFDFSGIFSLF